MRPVTIREMFTLKTTIQGNRGRFFAWFFGIAVPCNVLIYAFNVTTNFYSDHGTTGIWLEAALQLTIFMNVLIFAQRKCAHLVPPK